MKIKSIFVALLLTLSFAPNVAQANVRPVVESLTFTPNEVELISSARTVTFESEGIIGLSVLVKYVFKVSPLEFLNVTSVDTFSIPLG